MADSQPTPPELEATETTGYDKTIGMEWGSFDGEEFRARVPVTPAILQPLGLVHGGVYAGIAESLASAGTYLSVYEAGNVAMGMSNNTTFMRPITAGTIHARAWPLQRGRTTWVWDCEMTDDEGRRCALSRVTIAVRPRRD
jgi:uncharacterized protein (TIGR00369 family)